MLCLQHQCSEKHVHSNTSKVKIASTTDSLLTIKTMNVAFKILSVPQYEKTILYFNSYVHKKQLTDPAGNIFDLLIQYSHPPLGSVSHNSNVRSHTQQILCLGWKIYPEFCMGKGPFSVQPDPKAGQLQIRHTLKSWPIYTLCQVITLLGLN